MLKRVLDALEKVDPHKVNIISPETMALILRAEKNENGIFIRHDNDAMQIVYNDVDIWGMVKVKDSGVDMYVDSFCYTKCLSPESEAEHNVI